MESLRLDGVEKKYPGFTLRASFEVGHGARAAVSGRSGSGKTTLLRIIAGLERFDGAGDFGRIMIGGDDVTRMPPEKRGIGYVFQDQALFPSMSVLDNAAFGLRMRGMGREERESLVMPWLEKTALAGQARGGVEKLSGGERQRLAFVRALVWKPRVILLDEPFSALDAGLRAAMRAELVSLHLLWPVPLLIVTHDVEDVEAVATARVPFSEDAARGVRCFG
ncbi:MAG: hypothetical protein A2583_01255 [Bdellovibrionales bacterium RIFOXYD1_FULL_53_11]|nr:MAG: hypothetical protein A2583_01255 [Bdellovibrionales bacterium RIFOXYD1_FULL_53_11]